ncbi:hypothetical protein E3O42_05480 [Cryobacterium adonitolivorans]|uniref:DUF222 domain-containing protein n=1 Tax=Cryobacterium adonitolivorans TaxID=1259189 RepID=A0A4R8WB51_9MICO|nr:hypothetical protein [Cryobacterium adonitolivorans]TFC04342.1 hypothetical protein E3O42_05480 [Cryobacterium adonitolivorans]
MTRSTNALTDRRTCWEAAHDGMGWLHWYGTAHQTKAAYDRINGMAVQVRQLGDPSPADTTDGVAGSGAAFGISHDTAEDLPTRTLDHLRADITAALLLDGITPTGMGAGIRGTVMVTVPVFTPLGLNEEPATLEGYGPISPEAHGRSPETAPASPGSLPTRKPG